MADRDPGSHEPEVRRQMLCLARGALGRQRWSRPDTLDVVLQKAGKAVLELTCSTDRKWVQPRGGLDPRCVEGESDERTKWVECR